MNSQKIPNIISAIHVPSINTGEMKKLCFEHFEKTGIQYWDDETLLQDKKRVLDEMEFWTSYLKPEDPPCIQLVVGNYQVFSDNSKKDWRFSLSDYSLDDFDYVVCGFFGSITYSTGNPDWATKRYDLFRVCPACGNKPINAELPEDFLFSKLPKKKSLFYFYPPHLHFARQKFIDSYEASGLTGLSFEQVGDDLFYINVALHRWNDRTGVCEQCEMKTNVIGNSYFNLPEQYLYDIQRVEVNTCNGYSVLDSPYYVFSRNAASFLKQDIRGCSIPILPNHLSDLVWPTSQMFTNGTYPTTVYREG